MVSEVNSSHRAIRLITAIGFITPAHSPTYEGTSLTLRLNIFHVGEVRDRGCEQRGKGDGSLAEKENRRSPFESPFMSRCKLPLNRSVGAVLPLFRAQAQPSDWSRCPVTSPRR